ncbi:Abi-like protein [Rheinheimera pacifica]|uniref:Abi-like protein n=1 Tax=Rheinheimera pacifica TaxID=173990 RepID=A0A1H6NHJ2_9GAMM|nr:Abi family protein [Rheinheimera pacifica]SEI11485.1 Abi-like protein [Rheinheimera pacifica]
MSHAAIEKNLSINRLSTYRNAILNFLGQDSVEFAIELYEWNAKLSASFILPLHIYEITLRNAISEAIALRYGNDWPIDPAFRNSLSGKQKTELIKASAGYIGVGKVLPELKLVWFENMLKNTHNVRIWVPYIKMVFPHSMGPDEDTIRDELKSDCFVIRMLRNRIAHHEPIFNQPNLANLLPAIIKAIDWRCAVSKVWLSNLEDVTRLMTKPVI